MTPEERAKNLLVIFKLPATAIRLSMATQQIRHAEEEAEQRGAEKEREELARIVESLNCCCGLPQTDLAQAIRKRGKS